jgi:uncharacterized protein (TIGR02246 family)
MNSRPSSRFVAALVMLIVAALALGGEKPSDPKLAAAIGKANSEWAEAMKTGDAATIAAPYAEDGVFVRLDGSCVKGRASIETMYRERFAASGLASETKIESKNLVVDGEMAYESGYGEATMKKEGKAATSGGRFLTVWRRQAGGDWKILRNIVLP